MKRVVVTGAGGKIGSALLHELRDHGCEVLAVDVARSPVNEAFPYRRADLRELWQALEVLRGADAVVHLAAIGVPEPEVENRAQAEQTVFSTNLVATYNVFAGAAMVGAKRVVWASSETTMGTPFESPNVSCVPLDEAHPLHPNSTYALSKAMGEELARQVSRWTGVTIVGLRFSAVMDARDYAALHRHWADPERGRWNLWSYVDVRDAVRASRLALEAPVDQAEVCIVAASDTTMDRPTRELLARWAPGLRPPAELPEHGSLLSSARARRLLGYEAAHTWREGSG
jgi:nucleoside-diphosphate-sugar epimerase